MMEKRLKLAKKLLNPKDSVLIVTIDEKEYLHLGCLLEEMFSGQNIQMVSSVINSKGVARNEFFRVNEYIYIIRFGECMVSMLPLSEEWRGNIKTSTITGIRWGSLMRSGSGSLRSDSPGCFYPVFISKDKKHFCGVGNVVPLGVDRHSVIVPKGQIALFPIHSNGVEGRWQYSKDKFEEIVKKGYVRISVKTKNDISLRYISAGWQKKVESGQITVIGRAMDGSLVFDDSDYVQKYIPSNQWWIPSHNATEYGSKFLQNIIGKRFSFPKSLYAVHDIIRFFVASKPKALVLDFFAGSGTTLHAINLLNAADGGQRRCIMVTNNEVSADEAKILLKRGIKPGDAEWERLGIAHYVTWPRTVCTIKGLDIEGNALKGDYSCKTEKYIEINGEITDIENGNKVRGKVYKKTQIAAYPQLEKMKMADGFKTNAAFFKLSFLDKTTVALGRQFKELLPVLWMKGGAIGKCPVLESKKLFHMLVLPKNKMAILLDEVYYPEFDATLEKQPTIQTIFIVTDSEDAYREMIRMYDGKDCYQLYRDYLDNFRINTGR